MAKISMDSDEKTQNIEGKCTISNGTINLTMNEKPAQATITDNGHLKLVGDDKKIVIFVKVK